MFGLGLDAKAQDERYLFPHLIVFFPRMRACEENGSADVAQKLAQPGIRLGLLVCAANGLVG